MADRAVEAELEALFDRARDVATRLADDPADPAHGPAVCELDRQWEAVETQAVEPGSAAARWRGRCAHAIGELCFAIKDHAAAQRRLDVAVLAYTNSAQLQDHASGLELAEARCSLAASLNHSGRSARGLDQASAALAWLREHGVGEADAEGARCLARAWHLVGQACGHLGRSQEAADAARAAIAIRQRLVGEGLPEVRIELARSHGNLALWLSDLGLHQQALEQTERALAIYREIGSAKPLAVRGDIARELNNLGTMLSGLGRHEEALRATQEALALRRDAARRNPSVWRAELASSLHNVGAMLHELERYGEALLETRAAVALRRELVAVDRLAHLFLLASSLINEGAALDRLGRHEEALRSTTESMTLFRELQATEAEAVAERLAMGCCDAAQILMSLGRAAEAEPMAGEAVARYRTLAAGTPMAFDLRLATSLNQHADALAALDRRSEAMPLWREAGKMLIGMGPEDPHAWCKQVLRVAMGLDQAADLSTMHLLLFAVMVERRELAHDADHARLYQSVQHDIVAAAWAVVERVATTDPAAVMRVAPAIVGVLHSPDLGRWVESRADPAPEPAAMPRNRQPQGAARGLSGERRALHAARREVIAADEAYLAWLVRRQAGEAVHAQLAEAAARAASTRQRYRTTRESLVAALGAEASFTPATLDELLGCVVALADAHAHSDRPGGVQAMLCLMTIGTGDRRRAVGLLVSTDARLPALLDLPGLAETAAFFERYQTAAGDEWRSLRRPAAAAAGPIAAGAPPRPALRQALEDARQRLVLPVVEALAGCGGQPDRCISLHLCTQGVLQHLPLAALHEAWSRFDVTIIHWPGLPYARAAAQAPASRPDRQDWLIAHDCAWRTSPLPMAAVEAALLAALVGRSGAGTVKRIDELSGQELAMVVCGHGESAAHLQSELALRGRTMSLERIVDERLSPRLALLPLCHAGETSEDMSGNAFGVAAAFLLGGAGTVVASSKAVDDQLVPWFTTLLVWHLMQPRPQALALLEAAHLARRQFEAGEFPPEYRRWLAATLPSALASVQPGGDEWESLARGGDGAAAATEALQRAIEAWPWRVAVDPSELFSRDAPVRAAAARAFAHSVLLPPDDGADEVAERLAELATFVFIYGAG